ncbi:ECF transporter S component [Acholeplasma laidlawii]|jgi:riboflavin transporter FmnP|uniref:Riboflavin transporter n=2 Tax=Acholeplasma laidlawii TaxID=2148 RepID=A9NF92_ACHLI|nr:ECF transporter S component [Acholeplasma laidlawii]ABX81022.1 integral membrane protein [Acholeplasma laidlawii PG-8A]NWH10409.1 ECF transporter S component [Acholeplasma laidlawii]NWH11796.1 ECF transporter S component [Acholeplasma laidlawii]NWH12796.1 ECF transporter S component [Acholeplasma laidlawii]NWH14390.1 ECF transporter S component [Acholeplasma laidlawii]
MQQIIEFLQNNMQIIEISLITIFAIALIILFIFAFRVEGKIESHTKRVKKMVTISILSAISVILYYFIKFPLGWIIPFIPQFLDIQFSAVPIYIGGFMFGPISGSIIAIIRFIVKLPGSSTLGTGELADLLIGLATVLVSSIMYHRNKTKKTAKRASISIVFVWVIAAVLSNWLFILPFYMNLYGFDAVLGMLTVIPGVNEQNYMLLYILYAVIPFNIVLSGMVSFLTFVLYKRLSIVYKKI